MLAEEATDERQLLAHLERAWQTARAAVAGRRRDSYAAAAVDILAATPLVSATSLAAGLGVAVKTAIRLLDELAAAGVAVEVTHRAKRRLFGLTLMAPPRDGVAAPRRPEPGRGRGRPPIIPVDEESQGPPPPMPPLTPRERREFDYGDLEHWTHHLSQTLRKTRLALDALVCGQRQANTVPAAPNGTDVDMEAAAAARAGQQGSLISPARAPQGAAPHSDHQCA